MAKLYFKFGAMGCSKSAQALITKFNYEERGMSVMLMKPALDTRDGADTVRSRIGLEAKAIPVPADCDIYRYYAEKSAPGQVVIVDECQFLTPEQVDQLSQIVIDFDVPVLCFGLSTDFLTHLFPGSRRLFEIAESVNARIDPEGHVLFSGEQVCLGGNDRYTAMCRKCWLRRKKEQEDAGIFT